MMILIFQEKKVLALKRYVETYKIEIINNKNSRD